MLVRGVVHDQVDDHLDAEVARLVQQLGEVTEVPEARVDVVEVLDVVAVVAVRRRVDRIEPQARDSQPSQIVQPPDQTADVAAAVTVRVRKRVDVEAVDDSLLIPAVTHAAFICPPSPRMKPTAGPLSVKFACAGLCSRSTEGKTRLDGRAVTASCSAARLFFAISSSIAFIREVNSASRASR